MVNKLATQYQHIKNFSEFRGVDLKSSDIERMHIYASGGKNSAHTERTGIVKRYGYQFKIKSAGGSGAYAYTKINQVTGAEEPEIILISDRVHKMAISSATITYAGAASEIIFSMFYSAIDASFKAVITEDGVDKLASLLGLGYDSPAVKTMAQLAAEVNALTGYTMTVPGSGSPPAAFMQIARGISFGVSTPLVIEFMYEVEVNKTVASPLAGSLSNRTAPEFENASAVNRNGVIYITNGYDDMVKYDGQTLFKAGLPNPVTAIIPTSVAAGSITDTGLVWAYSYVQIDNSGQEVESAISLDSAALSLTSEDASLVIPNILAGSGYNTNCAICSSTVISTNAISVDNGSGGNHTLQVGDSAYFYDGVSASYVSRKVTARSNTSITIAGSPITIINNQPISNNLRIAIWRTTASGFNKYLAAEVPNDSFAATQTYIDETTPADLGAEYLEPIYPAAPPPKCKYMTVFSNLIMITGNPAAPNTVYFSDVDGPESFPVATHAFDYLASNGQVNSGIGASNDQLCIFKKNAITAVSGDIGNLNFRLSPLTSGDIGCAAHATIQEIREGALFFLSDRGPYSVSGGQSPIPVGVTPTSTGQASSRIEPYFTKKRLGQSDTPKLRRAVAVNYAHLNLYLLFVPIEDAAANSAANGDSAVWAYDYSRDAWLPQWDSMNAAGGMAILNNRFFWTERKYSTVDLALRSKTAMQLRTVDPYDFADHGAPISWEYSFHWESLGEPSVFKKFLRLKIFALEIVENDSYTVGIRTEANYTEGLLSTDSQLKFGEDDSFGYGISEYGTAPYGDPVEQSKKIKLKSDHLNSMRILLSNSELHRNVIVTGYELEVAAPFKDIKE